MFWNANTTIATAAGVNGIGSPIDIEGGTVDLTASAIELGTQRITNNAILVDIYRIAIYNIFFIKATPNL